MSGIAALVVASLALCLAFGAHKSVSVSNPRGLGICTTFILPESAYTCYELVVETADGYRLALQRVTAASSNPTMGPVLLYHGLMQGGDIWVLNSPDEALAFLLADAGYEVFIGSTRSSIFSSHNLFTSSDPRYWEWCFDDLASHDLPSMLAYINSLTDRKVLLVAYSQGAQVAFAALSQRGNKAAAVLDRLAVLAPVVYLSGTETPLLSVPARTFLDQVLLRSGIAEFSLSNPNGMQLLQAVCTASRVDCLHDLLSPLTGSNCCLNASRFSYYSMYELQSTSVRNVVHLAQGIRTGRFAKYDNGMLSNMERYGTPYPPSYNLANIPLEIPIFLAYGGQDKVATFEDMKRLQRELGERQRNMIYLFGYGHVDFVLGTAARDDLYKHVINFFQGNPT